MASPTISCTTASDSPISSSNSSSSSDQCDTSGDGNLTQISNTTIPAPLIPVFLSVAFLVIVVTLFISWKRRSQIEGLGYWGVFGWGAPVFVHGALSELRVEKPKLLDVHISQHEAGMSWDRILPLSLELMRTTPMATSGGLVGSAHVSRSYDNLRLQVGPSACMNSGSGSRAESSMRLQIAVIIAMPSPLSKRPSGSDHTDDEDLNGGGSRRLEYGINSTEHCIGVLRRPWMTSRKA